MSIMQDDDLLLNRSAARQQASLIQMRDLGVDVIRVNVLWEAIAACANSSRGKCADRTTPERAANFKAFDPSTYPTGNWDQLDRVIRRATPLGLRVLLTVTGPGPAFAHERTSDKRIARTYLPKVDEFAKFVRAVGKRYDGTYADENDNRAVLPRVSMWSIWNEPNQAGWLSPQTVGTVPVSPRRYRELYFAGRFALQGTGHDQDTVLLGELAPIGSAETGVKAPLSPLEFIREVFCVDGALNPYTGAAAAARGCGVFDGNSELLRTSGVAHHPYGKKASPTTRHPSPSSVTMANLGDLTATLDAIAQRTGRLKTGLPVFLTEYGYESNPPDRFNGVSLRTQAFNTNLAEYVAYTNPRIASTSQFLLRDLRPNAKEQRRIRKERNARKRKTLERRLYRVFDTGLITSRGNAKPAAYAYALPILVVPLAPAPDGSRSLTLWGRARLRDGNNNRPRQVIVQFRPDGATSYTSAGNVATDAAGFFTVTGAAPQVAGTFRVVSSPGLASSSEPAYGISREAAYVPGP